MSIHELASHNVSVALDGRWLLRGINVALRAECLTAFLGPNGSGKTTLLRVLAGLLAPSEGHVTLHGNNVQGFGRRALSQRIAFVPQDTHVSFAFTVRETVEMGRHPHLRRFERLRQHDHDIVDEAMRRADVWHLAHRAVTALSGGERQRVIIARSLATQADVLLLDEPTANLDIAHALDVLDLCQQLAQEGKTSCFSEKGKMADSMCDGLLSPTSIALSIPGKTAGPAARTSRRLAVDNQEEPAIIAGYKLQSRKALFGQGKCRQAAVPATVPGTNAHEATVGLPYGKASR